MRSLRLCVDSHSRSLSVPVIIHFARSLHPFPAVQKSPNLSLSLYLSLSLSLYIYIYTVAAVKDLHFRIGNCLGLEFLNLIESSFCKKLPDQQFLTIFRYVYLRKAREQLVLISDL